MAQDIRAVIGRRQDEVLDRLLCVGILEKRQLMERLVDLGRDLVPIRARVRGDIGNLLVAVDRDREDRPDEDQQRERRRRDAVGQKPLEAAKLLVADIVLFVMMVCRLDFSCRHS